MPSEHFIKLPTSVLNDATLSLQAIVAYAILVDAADWDDRSMVTISHHHLATRLGCSRDTARRLMRELSNAGHLVRHKTPVGRRQTYRLTHSTHAPGTHAEPVASMPPPHSTHAPGTHSTGAPLRKSTLDNSILHLRTYGIEKVEASDELLQALLDLGWPAKKIRQEIGVIYHQIGGRQNERAFLRELEASKQNATVRNPFGKALERFRAQATS